MHQKLVFWKDQQNWQTSARLTKRREKTQFTKIRYENGDITTKLVEVNRIIRENYEQIVHSILLHSCYELDNLDVMDKFSETHKLPKLTEEEI